MRKLFLVVVLAELFFSISYGDFGSDSEGIFGFNPISKMDEKKSGKPISVDNLCPTMSQDTIGICFGEVSSLLLTAENCRQLKSDCTKINPNKIFSPLYLSRFQNQAAEGSEDSLDAFGGFVTEEGGRTANVLEAVAYKMGFSPSDECISLDKILSKIGGSNPSSDMALAQKTMWKQLKETYDNLHNCPTCLNDIYTSGKDSSDDFIRKNFNINKTNQEILSAFAQDTYGKFLEELLTPKECLRVSKGVVFEGYKKTKVERYPPANEKKDGNYQEAITKIKAVLSEGRPLSLNGLCLDEIPQEGTKCKSRHAIAIAGYRKICSSTGDCYDAVKVINSWGQAWQDKNSDGWVKAKDLLDRTFYKPSTLVWFSDKKNEN